ncbi:little elongation complex subunit 2 isoform X2 [Hetaerina americana]
MECLEFLKNFAISNQSRYSSICPDIKKYINELWKVKLKNPLKYPRYYRPYRTIGLVLNDSKELLDLKPEDEILKKGRVNILNLEKKVLKIERSYSKFVKIHPIINQEISNKETIFNCPVSQDPNAEVIAKNMNVDFVLSSSSLKRICDNYPPFNNSWEIPVIVKELDVEENGHSGKKRVIFIDKVLPRRRMRVVDKLALYHKIAIKRFLVHYQPSKLPQERLEECNLHLRNEEHEDFLQLDWCDANDHESFGVAGPNCSKTKAQHSNNYTESVNLKEQNEVPMEASDEVSASLGNDGLSEQGDNAEVSPDCTSDSDDEKWVIDVPEGGIDIQKQQKSQDNIAPGSKKSGKETPTIRNMNAKKELFVDESPKPRTRSVTKMLENLQKVEKIAGVKHGHFRENSLIEKISQLGSSKDSEAGKIYNANEEVKDAQCDNGSGVSGEGSKVRKKPLSLLDEILEQQNRWLSHERPKSNQCPSQPNDTKEKKFTLSGYQPVPPPRDGNYVYRLFSLKRKDISSPGYKLLIRCKIDAREAPPKHKTATIVSKLEFQPEFGAEIVTVSEMIHDWLSVRIRPNSNLIRARINAFTSDVTMVEQKECKDFYWDEKYHNTQASSCVRTLESVLHAFRDLPPAQYVFTHEPKMGAFGNIYVATNDESDGMYDLHEQYNVDTSVDEPAVFSSLWLPLDFSIITPLNEALGRVPGTFMPKNKKTKKKANKKAIESQAPLLSSIK